jgi:hypothetical protein
MKRFIEGEDRNQITLFPERLEDYVGDDNPVRVVDAFVEQQDLFDLGFKRVDPSDTGRPSGPLSARAAISQRTDCRPLTPVRHKPRKGRHPCKSPC